MSSVVILANLILLKYAIGFLCIYILINLWHADYLFNVGVIKKNLNKMNLMDWCIICTTYTLRLTAYKLFSSKTNNQ